MSTAGARLVPFVLAEKCAFFYSNDTAVRFPSNLTCQAKYLGNPQYPSDMSVCVFKRQTCELPTTFGKMFVKIPFIQQTFRLSTPSVLFLLSTRNVQFKNHSVHCFQTVFYISSFSLLLLLSCPALAPCVAHTLLIPLLCSSRM